ATARGMVVALGDFLRLTLKDGRTSMRSLAQELEFADLYMGIEKLRLGDRLILDYEIEPAAATAEVPHMLLQPLFENAIRHGAARLTRPCWIAFHARLEKGRLTLSLENDGLVCPAPPDAPSQGVVLTNTMARLSLHYGDDFVFEYTNRPQGGARIDLSLPWRKASRRGGAFIARSQDITRVISVEDEYQSRRYLRELLAGEETIAIVREAGSGAEGVDLIRRMSPDLVFIDIQMPDFNGFDLIAQIGVRQMPVFIFVTAYPDYAVRAFEVEAVDYICKPFDRDRLSASVERALR